MHIDNIIKISKNQYNHHINVIEMLKIRENNIDSNEKSCIIQNIITKNRERK